MVKIKNRISLLLVAILVLPFVFTSCKTTKSSTKTPPRKPEVSTPAPQPPVIKEKEEVKSDELIKKRMVLIMPFELKKNFAISNDEVIEPEINPASLGALNFYEGALIAVDSLKSQKVEVRLNSYDTPSDSTGVVRMMTNAAVKDADLVIASLPNNLAEVAARIAKTNNIKLVLTQAGSPQLLTDNANVALAYASTKTQCREMVAFMLDQFTNANIILLFRTTRREDELAAVFREEILKLKGDSDFQDYNATKKEFKDLPGVLSKTKRNLVFVISSDEAFVNPVLALLEEQNIFGIKVSGLPTWLNFESIDFNMFNNLQIHLFDNNFIDTDEKGKSTFRKSFVSRYYSDPLANAYNGFDIVYNLGLSLREEYSGMENLMLSSFKNENGNYNFISTGPGGIENKSISVLKINDYKLERLNK